MGATLQASRGMLHIRTEVVPIESDDSMSIGEQYHVPIRRAHSIFREEAHDAGTHEAVQMTAKTVDDSVGRDGLVPSLLVSGLLSRLEIFPGNPASSTSRCATSLKRHYSNVKTFCFRKRTGCTKSKKQAGCDEDP